MVELMAVIRVANQASSTRDQSRDQVMEKCSRHGQGQRSIGIVSVGRIFVPSVSPGRLYIIEPTQPRLNLTTITSALDTEREASPSMLAVWPLISAVGFYLSLNLQR